MNEVNIDTEVHESHWTERKAPVKQLDNYREHPSPCYSSFSLKGVYFVDSITIFIWFVRNTCEVSHYHYVARQEKLLSTGQCFQVITVLGYLG